MAEKQVTSKDRIEKGIMKASELMLHDLVMVDSEYKQVTRLDGLIGTIETESTKINKTCVPYNEEDVKPIPLTEEILKLNGFEETNTGFMVNIFERPSCVMKLNESGYYGIEVIGGYCNINANNEEHKELPFEANIKCNYAHELQHALRLCGLNELADNFKIG